MRVRKIVERLVKGCLGRGKKNRNVEKSRRRIRKAQTTKNCISRIRERKISQVSRRRGRK